MITGSKELIRDINSNLVLTQIVNHSPISRSAIAKKLGLTKATISAIVSDLLAKKLVVEIGSDDTSLGRKPILLSFNRKAGYAVSVDIGEQMISALITDLQGDERQLKQIATPSDARTLCSILIDLLHSMIDVIPERPYGVVGITLGIHGVTSDHIIQFTPYYDFSHCDLAKELEDAFHTTILLENEANLSVIGEKTFEYNYPNIANISVHSGVGLGILVNNTLYSGSKGYAGEIGHTIVDIDGKPCPCGNHGCLEQYVSERALLQDLALKKACKTMDFSTFAALYHKKDTDALEIMEQFVRYMSICVNNVLNMFNPDLIIINSHFTTLNPELIDRINKKLTSRINNYQKIAPSVLQDSSVLLGGISVTVRSFLGVDISMIH
ncbi:ROK family transcriptional regulator [Anaerosporobacter faecicola]|uniref:ROK family transcriptional regulator n=1 Tax=Anaerosporobacter faecicola TaxID=2718714 RepID=UPI00143B8BAD|nr:ROK family transcriptional regulator [Anaerosporobacter faecicola]